MKIAVIGAGNMGGALIKGWAKAAREGKADLDITLTARTQQTLDKFAALYPELHTLLNNKEAVKEAQVVLLAVKPWLIDSVLAELADDLDGKTVVSVAANARHDRIDVYAMPNIAAEFGQSMTFVETPSTTPMGEAFIVQEQAGTGLFGLVGQVMVVDQKHMGAGMMMAGCGIAYVMRFLRAMMEGGVEMGFYPKDAQQIAMQTMQGAITLLQETRLHPEVAIDKVTTPGGVTIKGLNELDHASFNSAVIRCLKAGLK